MLTLKDILATQDMIDKRHLDIRTITMGISLLDCAHEDVQVCADRIYEKIVRRAENLVKVGEEIEWEFGIPIVNKRISVTPIAIVGNSCQTESYVPLALAMDRAADTCGVNFIGGFSALVQKGCTKGDWVLMNSIPEALAATKRYTNGRIRRALLYLLSGVTVTDLATAPAYLRLLAMNKQGREFLSKTDKIRTVPVVSKQSEIAVLGEAAARQRALSLAADGLFSLCAQKPMLPRELQTQKPYLKINT